MISIKKSLIYYSLFNYPLTLVQLWKFFIWENKTKPNYMTFIKTLDQISGKYVFKIKDHYLLNKNKLWIFELEKRKAVSLIKYKIAEKTAKILSFIPSVEMIALTGKNAVMFSDSDDDIDFLIICSRNTLWITRLIISILLIFLGLKRNKKQSKDRICLNMFLDKINLKIPFNERDIYSAHELAQLKVIYNKNNTYLEFLSCNNWLINYLPNSAMQTETYDSMRNNGIILKLLNNLFYTIQFFYMRKKITDEKVSLEYVRFHPFDNRKKVIYKYNKLIKNL